MTDDEEPDRFAVIEALRQAATDRGWRVDVTEFHSWRIRLTVLPPLAQSRPDRNRWPGEPEEGPEDHGA